MADKILVVDDNYLISELIKDILTDEGYAVVTADSGAVAMDVINKSHLALIIVDYHLSGSMTGVDLIRRVRKHADHMTRDTIILGLSGSNVNAPLEFAKAGVGIFLKKPVEEQTLVNMVNFLLDTDNLELV
jgi:two-component system nitrogen regulation response regulator NtrX